MRSAHYRVTVTALAFSLSVGWTAADACTTDPECDDGAVCNGAETCDVGSGLCQPGTPLANGTQCDAGTGVVCSLIDVCQAGVCVPGGGGDGDGDDLCDAEDNCPAVANAGQGDLDGDEIGDVCDAADRTMEIVIAKLKFDKAAAGRRPNGRILLKGEFFTAPPLDAFDPEPGVLLRVQDSLGLDQVFVWAPGECEVRTNQAGEVRSIRCRSLDNRYKAKISPHRKFPQIIRFKITLKQLPKEVVPGPFFGPVTVTVTSAPAVLTTGTDRVGAIVDCQQVGSGMKCKE